MTKLTVLIPAAGKGTRLQLPYPKELLKISNGKSLIDFTFDLFANFNNSQVEFVVILNKEKTELISYLKTA